MSCRLDETCSHVAAILFKTQAAVVLGLNKGASTSKACEWNKVFRKNVTASKIKDMQLAEGTGTRKKRAIHEAMALDSCQEAQIRSELKKFSSQSGSVFMTSVSETPVTDVMPADLPMTLIRACILSRVRRGESVDRQFCTQFVEKLPSMFAENTLKALEQRTRNQSQDQLWYAHRHGRLTASLFGDVMAHMSSGRANPSLLNRICSKGSASLGKGGPKALEWGRNNEPIACQHAVTGMSQQHVDVKLEKVGLVVRKELPYLGASPDAIMTCACPTCPEKRVVEVKCPYSMRDSDPDTVPYLDGDRQIRKTHKYYAQVQGQMFLCDVTECVFGVYTEKGTLLVVVERDDAFVKRMLASLKHYYVEEVLPALLSR